MRISICYVGHYECTTESVYVNADSFSEAAKKLPKHHPTTKKRIETISLVGMFVEQQEDEAE